MALVDYFLKIDGIPGESQDAKHKDEIDVLSFSFGVTNAQRGKGSTNDFSIVKFMDKASPLLFMAACEGDRLPKAIFTARKAGERPQEFLKVTFTDILISSVAPGGSTGGQETLPMESLSLNFAKVEIMFTPENPDGTPGKPVMGFCNFHK